MVPRYALESVDRTLRDLTNINLPFVGKIMLLGGDFRQLLPIKVNRTRRELINLSIEFSSLWKHFHIFSLTENWRTLPEGAEFAKYLLSVGDGTLNDNNDNVVPSQQCAAKKKDGIVEEIFKKIIYERRYGDLAKVAILSARNIDVEKFNSRVVELFDKTTERIYTSVDSVENCDNEDVTDAILPEYLNTLNPSNFSPYTLRLRNDSSDNPVVYVRCKVLIKCVQKSYWPVIILVGQVSLFR
ncbi:uncharacterized protein LOC117176786 [Belonocnema kinseyi]|uniref:uncharacterized protein LOC117176786 n=1 Tax=Belonocnema kinseyi TaxID=2817044 RepID=UPI00143CE48C|nr:uncharacterized protein LOC117176786 [Belonocnema kinseyi]